MDTANLVMAVMGEMNMQLTTFNIRCDYGQDGNNNFVYRKELIVRAIEARRPDIICFQEVLPHVAGWLKLTLKDYDIVGCGRSEDLRDEQVAVAYRRDRVNLIEMRTFWLSDTPYIPGSRYVNQSDCPRVCTEALFEDLESRTVVRVYNVHLDHIGEEARVRGIKLILKQAGKEELFPNCPVIIAGDFNAEPDSDVIRVLDETGAYTNAAKDAKDTFHGFLKEASESIDYVFIGKELKCTQMEKWMEHEGDVWLSDHYPISVWLKRKERQDADSEDLP